MRASSPAASTTRSPHAGQLACGEHDALAAGGLARMMTIF
jgi:hypothetical protein